MATAARLERYADAETSRRDQILAAARKVFRKKGYDNSTVSDIVQEAGVAQGTFYLYFPSKKEAFFALAQELPGIMAKSIMGAYDPNLSFDRRVRQMTHAAFRCGRANADLVRLINFGGDSIAVEVQAEVLKANPVVNSLAEMFRRDMARGNIVRVDPELTARLLIGMYKNALIEAFVLGTHRDAVRLERALAELVINALKRRPRRRKAA